MRTPAAVPASAGGRWPYGDQVMADVMGQRMAQGARRAGALLLGRRTYQDFAVVWPLR